jgi:hypothetical protein
MAKYEKTERLEKVPMEYLWEGLVLSDNLYNYNGSQAEKLSRKANLIN